jgi:hypothetical protein
MEYELKELEVTFCYSWQLIKKQKRLPSAVFNDLREYLLDVAHEKIT